MSATINDISPSTTAPPDPPFLRGYSGWILLILPLPLYAMALPNGLLRIDDLVQYHAPLLHDGGWYGLIDVWLRPWFYDYSPVTLMTQWLDRALGDDHDHWYVARVQNSLWLGLGALAIRSLLARIVSARLAFAVALIYVLHPVCADGTLWLAERKNLVALALSFWSCERYLGYRQGGGHRTAVAAVLLGVFALLAKPHAVAIPAMIAAWELLIGSDGRGLSGLLHRSRASSSLHAELLRAWPLLIIGLIVVGFVVVQITQRGDIGAALLGGSRAAAAWCDGFILARYLGMVVDPNHLTLYYPVVESAHDLATLAACWLAVAAAVAVSLILAQRRRLVLFAWAFAGASILPALNLVAQNVPMTDYYLQWALPGLLLVLLVVVTDVLAKLGPQATRRAPLILGVAAAGCALLTLARIPEFANRNVFFTTALARQPETAVNIGGFVYTQVRYHDARYSDATGALALHAASLPSARRMLEFTVPDTAVEAGVAAWRQGGRAAADAAVSAFPVPGPDTDLGLLVQARILIGASRSEPDGIHLSEAKTQLGQRLGPGMLSAATTVGPQCEKGEPMPDGFPPVLALPIDAGATDEFLALKNRHDRLRLLIALAEAREAGHDGPGAFAAAALALNLDPTDADARIAVAGLYARAFDRPDLGQRLLGR